MSLNVNKITVFTTAICSGLITLGLVSATVSALEYQSNPVDIKFEFGSTLTINTDGNIAISNLTPGTANVSSSSYRVTVNTNNVAGYTLTATVGCSTGTNCYNNKTLSDGTNTFSMVTSTSGTALTAGEWGFTTSGSATATSSAFKTLALYSDTTPTTLNKTKNATGTAYDSTYIGNNTTPFQIGAYAANDQVAGTYTNVINFSAVANPVPEYTVTLATVNATNIIVDGTTYTNGDTPSLAQGMHTISGTFPVSFTSWTSTGGVTVANTSSANTTITVTGTGTLTLTGQEPPLYMQDMTLADCSADGMTVYDKRDESSYTVKKLADGYCWMTQNLALDLTALTQAQLYGTGTNAGKLTNASNTTLGYLKNGGGTTSDQYPTAKLNNDAWTSSSQNYYSIPMMVSSGTCNNAYCVNGGAADSPWSYSDSTSVTINGVTSRVQGKIGIYYNFCAASAGSYCYGNGTSAGTSSGNASEDICPYGWHLPAGDTAQGSFSYLYNTGYSANYNNFVDALSTPLSGYFYSGKAYSQGYGGRFWSYTRNSNNDMYSFRVDSSSVYLQYYSSRYNGFSVRCVRTS